MITVIDPIFTTLLLARQAYVMYPRTEFHENLKNDLVCDIR
jgi:hypothetical protein